MTHSLSLPLIDWDSLRCLSDGDRQFEVELLQLFISDTASHLSKLQQAIADQDVDPVRRLAHHLKGASANVGALSFSDIAGQLEQQARDGSLAKASTLYSEMKTVFSEIEHTIATRA